MKRLMILILSVYAIALAQTTTTDDPLVVDSVSPSEASCFLSISDWATSEWPVESIEVAGATYGEAELAELLSLEAAEGETLAPHLMVAQQLVALKLNMAKGCAPSPEMLTAMVEAEALLQLLYGRLPQAGDAAPEANESAELVALSMSLR